MRKEKVVVLIPIYKAEITHFEKISLMQCVKILSKYPIKFFAPENLDLKNYSEIYPNLSVEVFDPVFFKNIQTYNNLMLSSIFYKRFIGYKYMLIYQLDAFVFRDELEFWCNKGFDYIGSPWFDHNLINNIHQSLFQSKYLLIKFFKRLFFSNNKNFVGNGGLSLRRVKTLYYITKFKFFYKNIFISNEDIFWGVFVPMFYPFFKPLKEKS